MSQGIPKEYGAEDIRDAFRRQSQSTSIRRAAHVTVPRTSAERVSAEDREEVGKSASDYISLKAQLQERVIDEMQRRNLLGSSDEALTAAVEEFIADVLEQEDLPVTESERGRIAQDLVEETLGIGPLAPLMSDPAITDILVNGHDQVFIERFGRLEETDVRFRDDEHVRRIIMAETLRPWMRRSKTWRSRALS